jgi:hypothetical protein
MTPSPMCDQQFRGKMNNIDKLRNELQARIEDWERNSPRYYAKTRRVPCLYGAMQKLVDLFRWAKRELEE